MPASRDQQVEALVKARAVRAQKAAERRAAKAAPAPTPQAARLPISEFIRSPQYLNDNSLSVPQWAIIKAIYGEPMTPEELACFKAMSGGKEPRKGGYQEASIGAGRRSGKGEKIGSIIAIYEAVTFDREEAGVAPGETPYVFVVAQNTAQAMVLRDYIEAKCHLLEKHGWSVLEKTPGQEKPVTLQAIRLENGVVVKAMPCKKAAVRGYTGICVICDEIGHWQTEENAYNADVEVVRALRPTMATIRRRKFLRISTPFFEAGVLYEDWKNRDRTRTLVLHEIPTEVMNPTISKDFLAQEQLEDPANFQREYLAKWGAATGNFIPAAQVRENIPERGRLMVPYVAAQEYCAWIDVAFKRDLFAAGVGHNQSDMAWIDKLRYWKPISSSRPLDPEATIAELVEDVFRPYGIRRVYGDQFCDVMTKEALKKHEIEFVLEATTAESKYEAFKNLKAVLASKKAILPDDEEMIRELTSLIARRQPGGRWIVQAPNVKGYYDDVAIVVAGLVMKLLNLRGNPDIVAMNDMATRKREKWQRTVREESMAGMLDEMDDWADDIQGAIL
jgi:hypothetical protein